VSSKYNLAVPAVADSCSLPLSVTIVDDYNSALYLSSREIYDAPIRYISSENSSLSGPGLEAFESPNYVLGLGASMMNEVSQLDCK